MKKKLFVVMFLAIVGAMTITLMASEVSDAQRALGNAQKELSSAIEKRDKLSKQLAEQQTEYEAAKTKVEENKDKPKSIAYKNAVKKSESLDAKITNNKQTLDKLNSDINSLYSAIDECRLALQVAQQKEEAEKEAEQKEKIAKKQEKENKQSAEQETPTQTIENKTSAEQHKDLPEAAKEQSTSPQNTASNPREDSACDEDEGGSVVGALMIVGFLLLCCYLAWRDFKRRHHCPNCGKWFTLESEGDIRKREYDNKGNTIRRGALKKYRCSHCNHTVQFIEWFRK